MSDLEQSDNEDMNSLMGEDSDVEDVNPLMKLKQSITSIASNATNVFKSTLMNDVENEGESDNDINDDERGSTYFAPYFAIDTRIAYKALKDAKPEAKFLPAGDRKSVV